MIINYRGSIGYGIDSLKSLVGKCGVQDVEDCKFMIRLAIKEFPLYIDETNLIVYGGSHGGFLTAHLLGDTEMSS